MKKILDIFYEKLQRIHDIRDQKKETDKPKKKNSSVKTQKTEKIEVVIASSTVVKILLIVALFMVARSLFVQLQNILTITAICFFLAIGLTPIVNSLEKRSIPRPIAILILYIGFLGALTVLFVAILPVIVEQVQPLLKDLTVFGISLKDNMFLQELVRMGGNELSGSLSGNFSEIFQHIQKFLGSTLSILSNVFQGIFNFGFALVLLFFILLEREMIGTFFLTLFPAKDREYIQSKMKNIQEKISKWFRGQAILMVSIGLMMYVGMKIFEYMFGMEHALTIALLAGFMELFPYIGVIITGLFAALIALNISWPLVVAIIAWIALVQFLEGNLLVPIVMEKVTGLSSVVVILALAIGGILGNAAGGLAFAIIAMILSIPIAASIAIFVEEYTKRNSSH